MERIPTWRDIPAEKLIALLSALFSEDGVLIRGSVFEPEWAVSKFAIPFELLPVSEILNARFAGPSLPDGSRRVVWAITPGRARMYAQGVYVGKLVDSIAKGLGIKQPKARRSPPDLAAQIIWHLNAV